MNKDKEIETYLVRYFGIQTTDIPKISHYFVERFEEKGSYILKQGKLQPSLSILKSGYVRIFSIDPKSGKEITQWICSPGSLVTDVSNLFFGMPAKRDFQTLTDCELYTINQENYNQIGTHIPEWTQLEKLFMAKCFSTLEDRIYSHLAMTSEERYQMLFEYSPSIFNHVPLQYIASMLGMTPETLSRVRKKLSS